MGRKMMEFTLGEEMTMRVALKRYIKYLGSLQSVIGCSLPVPIGKAAECYALVQGIEPHTNERLIEVRSNAEEIRYAKALANRPYRDKFGRPNVQDVSENPFRKHPFDKEPGVPNVQDESEKRVEEHHYDKETWRRMSQIAYAKWIINR